MVMSGIPWSPGIQEEKYHKNLAPCSACFLLCTGWMRHLWRKERVSAVSHAMNDSNLSPAQIHDILRLVASFVIRSTVDIYIEYVIAYNQTGFHCLDFPVFEIKWLRMVSATGRCDKGQLKVQRFVRVILVSWDQQHCLV